MSVDNPGFHAHSGWFFRREADGSVRILAPDSAGAGAHQTVVLDAGTWASVVASVCAKSESTTTYHAVTALHAGRPGAMLAEYVPAGASMTTPTAPTCAP